MKFNSSVIINASRDRVVELYLDQSQLAEHQDGFLRKETLSGLYPEVNAKSRIYFKQGKSEMELEETVVSSNLPYFLETFIHHKHMDNTYKVSFNALSDGTTEYKVEGEYVAVRGFIPKMMMNLFPGMFKKQPEKWMQNCKKFVEVDF